MTFSTLSSRTTTTTTEKNSLIWLFDSFIPVNRFNFTDTFKCQECCFSSMAGFIGPFQILAMFLIDTTAYESLWVFHLMAWNTWILWFDVEKREEAHNCESNKWPFLWGWDECGFARLCTVNSHLWTWNFEWSDETGLMTGIKSQNSFYRNCDFEFAKIWLGKAAF